MARFKVELELANNDDVAESKRGHLDPTKVRRVKLLGVVDSGASHLELPQSVVKQLGLTPTSKVKVTYADGRTGKRPVVQGVYLKLLGRDSVFKGSVEPKRDTALIGAIVLEYLDFLIDPRKERLYPRDPDYIVTEIE